MTPVLLFALDCERVATIGARWSLAGTDSVSLRRGHEVGSRRGERTLEVTLADPRMSSSHARLIRVGERWIVEDLGSKNGTIVNGRPLLRAALSDGDLIEVGRLLLVYRELEGVDVSDLDRRAIARKPRPLRTLSALLERAHRALAERIGHERRVELSLEAGSDAAQAARALHQLAGKHGKLMMQRAGALDLARAPAAGLLAIDEADRLSTAERRALSQLMRARAGLSVALIGGPDGALSLPALRDRREDLGFLIAGALHAHDGELDWAIEPDAARALFRHPWPGNELELERLLHEIAPNAGDGLIRLEQLPELSDPTLARVPDDIARDELCALLTRTAGNVSAVARELGRERSSVRRQLRKLRIDPRAYR